MGGSTIKVHVEVGKLQSANRLRLGKGESAPFHEEPLRNVPDRSRQKKRGGGRGPPTPEGEKIVATSCDSFKWPVHGGDAPEGPVHSLAHRKSREIGR